MRTLVFKPLIPMPLWVSLAAAALVAGLAYVFYKPPEISRTRRAVVAMLWYLGVAGPLALLLNPSWLYHRPEGTAQPHLRVLLDTSQSMGTEDVNGQSRLTAALADLRRALHDLAGDFDVELLGFDDGVRPTAVGEAADITPAGELTDIAGALDWALRGSASESGAVLLLSDGADNASAGPDAALRVAGVAQALSVPIFTRTYGSTTSGKDLAIEVSSPRELTFVKQTMTVTGLLRQRGFSGGVARVTLSDQKKSLAQTDVRLEGSSTVLVPFEVHQDEPGVYLYELEVDAAPDEITRLNNRCTFRLIVVDEPIQVLVLEGKPYWDSAFLLRTLCADEAVAVTGAVRLTDRRVILRELVPRSAGSTSAEEEADRERALPTERVRIVSDPGGILDNAEWLGRFQIVILGRDTEVFLTEGVVANLKQWVAEAGGTLLCARGRPMSVVPERLDPLMPVHWVDGSEGRLRVRLTAFGESLRWFPSSAPAPNTGVGETWQAQMMPSLATSQVVTEVKPLASVIARAEAVGDLQGTPVVTYQPYGSGHTLVLEGSGMWRWAFSSLQYEAGAGFYRHFWSSLLRWMVSSTDFLPGQTVALKPSRSVFTTREAAVIFAMLKSEEAEFGVANPPVIEIVSEEEEEPLVVTALPSGKEVNLFRAVASGLPAGCYQARLMRRAAPAGEPSDAQQPLSECVFEVQPPLQEQLDLAARPSFMARLAQASGGTDLTDAGAGGVGAKGLEAMRPAYADHWMRTHPAEIFHTTAWDRLWVMTLAVGIWSAAWLVRRRGGLV